MAQPRILQGIETGAARPRHAFIDALRLVAAVQMIVGHTLDALLDDGLRGGPGFAAWTFVRGLTSVSFFCAAGLSFVLASRAPDRARARRRRLGRALELLVLGYALRAPLGLLVGQDADSALTSAVAVDVLQCMAVALLACELLCSALPTPGWRALAASCAGAACVALAAPLAGSGSCNAASAYWDLACSSPFPLFPWLGYPLLSLAVGELCLVDRGGRSNASGVISGRLFASALGVLALWALVRPLFVSLPALFSPAFALLKLGLVLGLAALLSVCVRRLSDLFTKLASQTLFLYATHVVVLYAGRVGLRDLVGHRLPLAGALAAAFALVVATAVCAVRYERFVPALRRGKRGGTPRPERRPPHPG